MQQINFKQKKS